MFGSFCLCLVLVHRSGPSPAEGLSAGEPGRHWDRYNPPTQPARLSTHTNTHTHTDGRTRERQTAARMRTAERGGREHNLNFSLNVSKQTHNTASSSLTSAPPGTALIGRLLRRGWAGLGRRMEHAQLRWKPFSMVAASRRSRMMTSEEYSGSFR